MGARAIIFCKLFDERRMNIGETVQHDLKLGALVKSLQPQTRGGEEWLLARLMSPTTDTTVLRERQAQIRSIRSIRATQPTQPTQPTQHSVLAETEADVKSLANIHADSRNSEYYSQIMWTNWTSDLNEIGWLTDGIVFLKAILQPILLLLIPFILLLSPLCAAAILQTPMNPEIYINVLSKSLAHATPIGKPRFAGRGGVFEVGEQIVHMGIGLAMLIGGAWSQWTSSRALRGIVADMRRRATALQQSASALRSLCTTLGLTELLGQIPRWSESTLGAFGQAWNSPHLVELQLRIAGEVDGLLTLASLKRTAFPDYSESESESDFSLTDLWIPGTTVYNSVELDKHILLTGPNRGGKSTFLRALGTAVLMSQTFGIVFARKARLPVFSTFLSSLEPVGVLGSKSLFEAEIDFAKEVQSATTAKTKTFVMMDEIFHGTNAHDGVEAAQIFLDELYTSTTVFSVVSTHYLELPTRYKDRVQAMCMDATRKDDGKLEYTYRLKRGVNALSSVREILEERGFTK